MRFNQDAVKNYACLAGDKEGKLAHKVPKEGFRERWIKLKGNLLFYFKLNDFGTARAFEPPVGVLVVEACTVREEAPDKRLFVFSIEFEGEPGSQKHFFACQSQIHCREWITAIQNASYALLKARLESLRSEFKRRKLKEPPAPAGGQPHLQPTNAAVARRTMPGVHRGVVRPQVSVPKKTSTFFTDWEAFE